MNKQEFNLKCAEFMEYAPKEVGYDDIYIKAPKKSHTKYILFNPHSDANDRNKVIEKMRIGSEFMMTIRSPSDFIWVCRTGKYVGIRSEDKSMEAAQIKCIEAVLSNAN